MYVYLRVNRPNTAVALRLSHASDMAPGEFQSHKDPQGGIPAAAGTQCRRCFFLASSRTKLRCPAEFGDFQLEMGRVGLKKHGGKNCILHELNPYRY